MTYAARLLLQEGKITRKQLDRALSRQAAEGGTIGRFLVEEGAILDGDLVRFLVRHFPGLHLTRKKLEAIPRDVIALIPRDMAEEFRILPVETNDNNLTLGMTDPSDAHAIEEATFYTRCYVLPAVVGETDMTWALETYYRVRHDQPSTSAPEASPIELRNVISRAPERPGRYSMTAKGGQAPVQSAIQLRIKTATMPAASAPETPNASGPGGEMKQTAKGLAAPIALKPKKTAAGKPAAVPRGVDEGWTLTSGAPAIPPRKRESAKKEPAISTIRSVIIKDKTTPPPSRVYGTRKIPARPGPKSAQPARPSAGDARKRDALFKSISERSDREDIIKDALELLSFYSARAIFLFIKKNDIRGWEALGQGVNAEAIKGIFIPKDAPSLLNRVRNGEDVYLGPPGADPADKVMQAALGDKPDRVAIVPVHIAGKVAGLFYLDRLEQGTGFLASEMLSIAETAGEAMARVILESKKNPTRR